MMIAANLAGGASSATHTVYIRMVGSGDGQDELPEPGGVPALLRGQLASRQYGGGSGRPSTNFHERENDSSDTVGSEDSEERQAVSAGGVALWSARPAVAGRRGGVGGHAAARAVGLLGACVVDESDLGDVEVFGFAVVGVHEVHVLAGREHVCGLRDDGVERNPELLFAAAAVGGAYVPGVRGVHVGASATTSYSWTGRHDAADGLLVHAGGELADGRAVGLVERAVLGAGERGDGFRFPDGGERWAQRGAVTGVTGRGSRTR